MLRLALAPSRQLAGLFCVLYGTAAACVLLLPLPVAVQALLLAAVCASAVRAVGGHALGRFPGAIRTLELDGDCRATLLDATGKTHTAYLLPATFVLPMLSVLSLRLESGKRRTLLITPDRVDAEGYRRLRVLLRWRCGQSQQDTALLP